MAISSDIALPLETTGAPVIEAAVKFKDGMGGLVVAIHVHHLVWVADSYFPTIAHVADTPHPSQKMIFIIEPFQNDFTLVDAVPTLRFLGNEIGFQFFSSPEEIAGAGNRDCFHERIEAGNFFKLRFKLQTPFF